MRVSLLARARVLALRREDKSRWERRVPLTPRHVGELVKAGARVLVQPSPTRVFHDSEYERVGAELREDLSEAEHILAVKEVPAHLLLPSKTYYFFSHTIKAQRHNMPLLDAILEKKIRLIDYERIVDNAGVRLVKFGKFAGNAGMIDALAGVGDRLLQLGYATPLLYMSYARSYPSLGAAQRATAEIGQMIAQQGIPKELHPFTFTFVGMGAVGKGAVEVFEQLPHKYATLEELQHMHRTGSGDRHVVYGLKSNYGLFMERKTDGGFALEEYYKQPQLYRSRFAEKVLPVTRVLVNCQYWDANYPRLLTRADLLEARRRNDRTLIAVQDISMDLNGSVEFTREPASIDRPWFVYDPETDALNTSMYSDGVLLLAVDNLPAELPRDASEAFGDMLMPYILPVAKGGDLPVELQRATITAGGSLSPAYSYIQELRQKTRARRVLVLGAGLVAKPAVDYLVKHGHDVTVAADDLAAARRLAEPHAHNKSVHVAATQVDAAAIDSSVVPLLQQHDCVLSLVPATMHAPIARACVQLRRHMVTASYISPAMRELDGAAQAAGVALFNELGLDPGIDHVEAMACMDAARAQGLKIREFESWCGGLPAPENADNPLGYKFSWSPRGVLNAAKSPARYIRGGQVVEKALALDDAQRMNLWMGFALEGYPNRDSTAYRETYGLQSADVVLRGTLRFEGYSEIMRTALKLGLLDDTRQPALVGQSWAAVMASLESRAAGVPISPRVRSAFQWLGLYSSSATLSSPTLIDSFCELLRVKLALAPHDRDLVLMQHRIVTEDPHTGRRRRHVLSLVEYGVAGGETAMSRTVGVPAAIGVHLLLTGAVNRRGVFAPVTRDVYEPVLRELHANNIRCTETIEEL